MYRVRFIFLFGRLILAHISVKCFTLWSVINVSGGAEQELVSIFYFPALLVFPMKSLLLINKNYFTTYMTNSLVVFPASF